MSESRDDTARKRAAIVGRFQAGDELSAGEVGRMFGLDRHRAGDFLRRTVHKLRAQGHGVIEGSAYDAAALAKKAQGYHAGRPERTYRLAREGEKDPKLNPKKAATATVVKKPKAPVIPPLPKPLTDLQVRGSFLDDDDTVRIVLRNGQGTYIAQVVGYQAAPK